MRSREFKKGQKLYFILPDGDVDTAVVEKVCSRNGRRSYALASSHRFTYNTNDCAWDVWMPRAQMRAMITRLEQILRQYPYGGDINHIAGFVANWLVDEHNVLVPLVWIGQTVWAVIDQEDPPTVEPWEVRGVAFVEGRWYAVDKDGDQREVGTRACHLTKEIAEQWLKHHKGEKKNAENANKVD